MRKLRAGPLLTAVDLVHNTLGTEPRRLMQHWFMLTLLIARRRVHALLDAALVCVFVARRSFLGVRRAHVELCDPSALIVRCDLTLVIL